jgi:excisionase family DNA binding protein
MIEALQAEPKPKMADSPNGLLLNLSDAGAYLGLTIWQIRGLVTAGEIPVVKVGRKLYIRKPTLARWAERTEGKHHI